MKAAQHIRDLISKHNMFDVDRVTLRLVKTLHEEI